MPNNEINPNPETDIDELDVAITVLLDHPDFPNRPSESEGKTCYHGLYASQLYGTFFGLLGRFGVAKIDGDANRVAITSLHLIMVNYTGVINMGFYQKERPKYSEDSDTEERSITVGVQAGSQCMEETLDLTPNLIVTKGTPLRIVVQRLLYPIEEIKNHGNGATRMTVKLPAPNRKDKIFDTEFYYRSGTDHYFEMVRNGMYSGDQTSKLLWPGLACSKANINLFF